MFFASGIFDLRFLWYFGSRKDHSNPFLFPQFHKFPRLTIFILKLRVCAVDTKDFQEPPESCDLEFMLKPPAYRQSVEKLRLNKQMSFVGAFKIYKKTEAEYRNIPKSYFIPLSRRWEVKIVWYLIFW